MNILALPPKTVKLRDHFLSVWCGTGNNIVQNVTRLEAVRSYWVSTKSVPRQSPEKLPIQILASIWAPYWGNTKTVPRQRSA